MSPDPQPKRSPQREVVDGPTKKPESALRRWLKRLSDALARKRAARVRREGEIYPLF
jgi:hypothetical protein